MRPLNLIAPSHQSLFLQPEIVAGDQAKNLASATGFLVNRGNGVALATARHVLTGRHNDTGECLDTKNAYLPTHLTISFRHKVVHNKLFETRVPLYDEAGKALWLEHPKHGAKADIGILPVTLPPDTQFLPYPSQFEKPLALAPMDPVSVIGFPLGKSSNTLAIWTSGCFASEPDIDHDWLPVVLVSCRTTYGQSGSPVLVCRTGTLNFENGASVHGGGSAERFIGLYSGRLDERLDIGRVWKAAAVLETAKNGTRSSVIHTP
jgi:hypothetical protein